MTSAAGFDRVNVIQIQLLSDAAANELSSTSRIIGNALIGGLASKCRKNAEIARSSSLSTAVNRESNFGAVIAKMPGKQTRGSRNPSGRLMPLGISVGNVRRTGPAAATTNFDPALSP